MTVAELIAELQKLPADDEVTISYDGGYGGDAVRLVRQATMHDGARIVVLSDFE